MVYNFVVETFCKPSAHAATRQRQAQLKEAACLTVTPYFHQGRLWQFRLNYESVDSQTLVTHSTPSLESWQLKCTSEIPVR